MTKVFTSEKLRIPAIEMAMKKKGIGKTGDLNE
jgi:hypothetical protein